MPGLRRLSSGRARTEIAVVRVCADTAAAGAALPGASSFRLADRSGPAADCVTSAAEATTRNTAPDQIDRTRLNVARLADGWDSVERPAPALLE